MPQITELSPDLRLAESPRLLSIKRLSDEAGTWVCVLVKRAPHRKRSVLYRVRAWLAAWVAPKGIDINGVLVRQRELAGAENTAALAENRDRQSELNCPVGRFIDALESIGIPAVPARSEDAYAAFMHWWTLDGLGAVPSMKFFMSRVAAFGICVKRKRYLEHGELRGPHSITYFGDPRSHKRPDEQVETAWLGDRIAAFKAALATTRGQTSGQ